MSEEDSSDLRLQDGSKVAVIGGGPAGSLFAYFLLSFAQQAGLKLRVDIYEPRDFTRQGPMGCNMCGGIVSESLVQELSMEGIQLPTGVVRRTIDSYVLHTDSNSLEIAAPRRGTTTAAVQRGGGPGGLREIARGGLDGHLLNLARGLGARVEVARIREVKLNAGRPQLLFGGEACDYDLLAGATGVNSIGWQLFEQVGLPQPRPKTTRAYIAEMSLGQETITRYFGNSMHILLMNMPKLEFAALIPKGEFLTVVLLGQEIGTGLISAFFASPAMKRCLPGGWNTGDISCHCTPRINVGEAATPFSDRVVLVGDSGVTRLYKDGLGAAFYTARAAAFAAVYHGVSAADFRRHFLPTYRSIALDNRFGRLIFDVVHQVKRSNALVEGMLKMAGGEQKRSIPSGRMSTLLWDMFTGAVPYRQIVTQALHPRFLGRYLGDSAGVVGSVLLRQVREGEEHRLRGSCGCLARFTDDYHPPAPTISSLRERR